VRYCERCGQHIKPDEPYHETIPDSMSGARPTTYTHRWDCTRPPSLAIPRSH